MRVFLVSMVSLLCAIAGPTALAEGPTMRLGGLFFGDFYRVSKYHLPEAENASGFAFRRIFLTANLNWGDAWSGRARLEAFHKGGFEDYRFTHRVQDLWMTRALGEHQLSLGLLPTPTFIDVTEPAWGKRYLLRTPADIHGLPARDLGVSLKGQLSETHRLSYRLMYGSSETWEADQNAFDRYMGGVTWRPTDDWLVDIYSDYEPRPGPYDRQTAQVLVSRSTPSSRLTAMATRQDRDNDPDLELVALMGSLKLGSNTELIAQIHHLLEPSPKGNAITFIPFDPSAKATNFVAGLEYRIDQHFVVTPNIVWTRYEENDEGLTPEDDLQLRLTFFLNFE